MNDTAPNPGIAEHIMVRDRIHFGTARIHNAIPHMLQDLKAIYSFLGSYGFLVGGILFVFFTWLLMRHLVAQDATNAPIAGGSPTINAPHATTPPSAASTGNFSPNMINAAGGTQSYTVNAPPPDAEAVAAGVERRMAERARGIDPELKRRYPRGYGVIGLTKKGAILPLTEPSGALFIDWSTASADYLADRVIIRVPTLAVGTNVFRGNTCVIPRKVGARIYQPGSNVVFELVDSSAHGEVIVVAVDPPRAGESGPAGTTPKQ